MYCSSWKCREFKQLYRLWCTGNVFTSSSKLGYLNCTKAAVGLTHYEFV